MDQIPSSSKVRRGGAALGPALALVHAGDAPTRSVLTSALSVTRTTAGAVLGELESLGLIQLDTRPTGPAAKGRPSHRIAIDPDGPVVLAAQVHVDGFTVALVGLGGQIRAMVHHWMAVPVEPADVLHAVVTTGRALLQDSGRHCVGAGLAVPSAVAEPEGTALNPLHVAWRAGAPVREIFTEQIRRSGITGPDGDPPASVVANDINLSALAEYRHGAGRGAQHLLVVATGHRGVGGALMLNGELHTGSSGLALEVGHLTVNPAGRPCHCGGRGCLDVEVDPLAFIEAAGRLPDSEASMLDQAAALLAEHESDRHVRAATHLLIDRLGIGLAGLVNVLNPGRILLGGLHSMLLRADPERLQVAVADWSLWGRSGSVPLLACALEHNSLIGAAELALQPLLTDPARVLCGFRDSK